jgi:peroxiredoxin
MSQLPTERDGFHVRLPSWQRFRFYSRVSKSVTKLALPLLGVLLLSPLACAHHTFPRVPADGSSRWAAVGDPAPEVALPALDGSLQKLSSYAGRVVLVDFWATFCGPCRQELPALEALRGRYPEVVVLAVSIDDAESDDAVREVARDLHLGFPVLRDPTGSVAFTYMKHAMTPSTAIVGRDGRIRAIHIGYAASPEAHLEQEMQAAIAERAP